MQSIFVVGDSGEHELAYEIRVLDGDLQSDAGSQAVAEDVGFLDPEVSQQGGRVVRHLLDSQRAIDVGRVPMRLLLDGDDPSGLGKGR